MVWVYILNLGFYCVFYFYVVFVLGSNNRGCLVIGVCVFFRKRMIGRMNKEL